MGRERHRGRRGRILAGLTVCLLLLSCTKLPGRKGGSAEDRWNVLLVTFDTTRADRIGSYGNSRIETPTLDGLAEDGIRFARALSSAPITAPSHSTILTGRYPIAHGVRDNGLFVLGDEQRTLAEILRDEGYATAAAIGAYPLISRFGLDQGFDIYDDHLTGKFEDYRGVRVVQKEQLFFDERRAAQVNEALLPWLEERKETPDPAPFFAWVHYFDPHQPFVPAPPFDQLYADDLYDGEIAYADSRLGFLLQRLDELGELDRTLIVMTADHGEGLGEHNELTHAILAYNTTLHVPLIIRPPGDFEERGTVVDEWVGTVDVLPTILDLLDIPVPDGVQGRSLVPSWEGGGTSSRRRSVRYAENLSPRLTHGWGELRVLFEGPMKYIHGPKPELYDLSSDPRELHDLIDSRPEEALEMRDHLESFIRRHAVEGASTTEAVDEEVRSRLEALGYLGVSSTGGEVITERLRSDGASPRDQVTMLNSLSAAKQLLFDGKATEALPYTEKLVANSPETPLYQELYAMALFQTGRLDEAWRASRGLAREDALSEGLLLPLATTWFEQRDPEEALAALHEHLESRPSARAFWLEGTLRKRSGDLAGARRAMERALEVEPEFAPARIGLAVALAQSGENAAAEKQFLQALRTSPYDPHGHYNYGTFLLERARYAKASAHFERAVTLAPRYLEAHLALVAVRLETGDVARARESYETLQRLAPSSVATATAARLLAAAPPEPGARSAPADGT